MSKTDADNWNFYREWLARQVEVMWEPYWTDIGEARAQRRGNCRIVPPEELADPTRRQYEPDPDRSTLRTVISSELLEEYAAHATNNPWVQP